jgi:hypothetical protein
VLFAAGAVIGGFRPSLVRSVALVTIGVCAGVVVTVLWLGSEARDKRLRDMAERDERR